MHGNDDWLRCCPPPKKNKNSLANVSCFGVYASRCSFIGPECISDWFYDAPPPLNQRFLCMANAPFLRWVSATIGRLVGPPCMHEWWLILRWWCPALKRTTVFSDERFFFIHRTGVHLSRGWFLLVLYILCMVPVMCYERWLIRTTMPITPQKNNGFLSRTFFTVRREFASRKSVLKNNAPTFVYRYFVHMYAEGYQQKVKYSRSHCFGQPQIDAKLQDICVESGSVSKKKMGATHRRTCHM